MSYRRRHRYGDGRSSPARRAEDSCVAKVRHEQSGGGRFSSGSVDPAALAKCRSQAGYGHRDWDWYGARDGRSSPARRAEDKCVIDARWRRVQAGGRFAGPLSADELARCRGSYGHGGDLSYGQADDDDMSLSDDASMSDDDGYGRGRRYSYGSYGRRRYSYGHGGDGSYGRRRYSYRRA